VIGDATATLVWISPQPPDAAQTDALSSWARSRGVTLVAPRDERPPAIPVDASLADPVEDLLERARDAIVARDGEGVDRATAAADALLRAHPELPQAAWLMAEVERTRATRSRRIEPADPEAAARAWERAAALDGGRVPGIGEVDAPAHPAEATVSFDVPEADEASLDGRPLPAPSSAAPATRTVTTRAGLHALVVASDGAPVWAGWIEVAAGSSTLSIGAPAPVPCSSADFAGALLSARAAVPPEVAIQTGTLDVAHVSCEAWVAVSSGRRPDTLRIARCVRDRCGPATDWPEPPAWTRVPSAAAPAEAGHPARPWPAWATWALAGAGVALAAGIAVVASGALQSAPTDTRFVTGGLKTQ
jgi:hypothetical protein